MTVIIDLSGDDWFENITEFITEQEADFQRAMKASRQPAQFELVESLQEMVEKKIGELNTMLSAINRLPSMPDVERAWVMGNSIWLGIPANKEAFQRVRQALGDDYKRVSSCQHSNSYSVTYLPSNGYDFQLTIDLQTFLEGATCRIEKVGEHSSPVYKMVCK